MNFFEDYFNNASYTDNFGWNSAWNSAWNKEINKWLKFVFEIDNNFYKKGKKRVKQNNGYSKNSHRDAFLAEAFSMYYFSKFLNAKQIKVEPGGSGKNDIDFSCICFNKEKWFIEVKGPIWHGEVQKNVNLSKEEKINRCNELQYKNGESGHFSPQSDVENIIKDSIKNSLDKFEKNKNNALVIIPNMLRSLKVHPDELKEIVSNAISIQDTNNLLSKVIIVEKSLPLSDEKFEYKYFCVDLLDK